MSRARLRLRYRHLLLHNVLPALRWLTTTALIVALLVGGIRLLTRPTSVGALDFTPHTIGILDGVQGIAAADFDGDGDNDIALAGRGGVRVLENQGNFIFESHTIDDKPAERVQAVKLDADDRFDLLVTFSGSSPSVRWYRHVDGFNFDTNNVTTAGADAVAFAGDINGDGSNDIAVASSDGGVVVLERFMNDGSGTFTATTLSADSGVTALTVGDTDGDGYADIVTGGSGGLQSWDFDGSTYNRFDIDDGNDNRTHLVVAGSGSTTYIASADQSANQFIVYSSRHTATTTPEYTRHEVATGLDAKTVSAVDLDSDGDTDFLVTAQDDHDLLYFENRLDDSFTKETIDGEVSSIYGTAAADLDNDGDPDVVGGNHTTGTVTAYERLLAKPVASKPDDISQSTAGTGRVSFTTTISDADRDNTKIRVQYSTDGIHWHKPWLVKATADNGTVDLINSQGYQIGTTNKIDTNDYSSVKLTLTWDTKSSQNTGGPISGDVGSVQLRIIPNDGTSNGAAAVSSKFRVDNKGPANFAPLTFGSASQSEAALTWRQPTDSSAYTFKIYYGTDHAAVLEQRSDVWDSEDDPDMNDVENTDTTITGLTANKTYTFKLFVTDEFGNATAAPSVRGLADGSSSGAPVSSTPSATPAATPTSSPGAPTPTATPAPTPEPTSSIPSTLTDNQPPTADAGPDQVINPGALVILDATASVDVDLGDTSTLTYSWRQLSGPQVDLLSARTAVASFSAGDQHETYIFSLTVKDQNGASAIDTITVATKELPPAPQTPVDIVTEESPADPPVTSTAAPSPLIANLLEPANLVLFILSLLTTAVTVAERLAHAARERRTRTSVRTAGSSFPKPQAKVVHYQTGEPIAGAQVLIYSGDGKLRTTERTNDQGSFGTYFPAGTYTIGVEAPGFTFAPTASRTIAPPDSLLYTGGRITIKDANQPLAIIIPMKPTAGEISSLSIRLLHAWQLTQQTVRLLSWPLFLAGALLNTLLVFLVPNFTHLAIEILYIVLVITKIALEIRVRPAYGLVRDAVTHIPLDLAVVRLFDQKSNRLIMTRVTNNQGKFFALPPAGTYRITIAKAGYATFSKDNVEIRSEHDTTLQLTADLMPVTPGFKGALNQAKVAS